MSRGRMSWSLPSGVVSVRFANGLVLRPFGWGEGAGHVPVEAGPEHLALEAELPYNEQDVVEQLDGDATAEANLGRGGAHAGPAVHLSGVAVAATGGRLQDVDERAEGAGALVPEELAGAAAAQDGRVLLDGDVLQARVGAFGEGAEVVV